MKRNLIDLATVIAISGLSRPTIYRHMDKGIFPHQVRCTDGRVRWYLVDVIRWCIKKNPKLFVFDVADDKSFRAFKYLLPMGASSHFDLRSKRWPAS